MRSGVRVEVQFDQFDSAVACELPNDREPRDQDAGGDQDAVVRATGDECGQVVEAGGEDLDDAKELKDLEVVRGWFAVRAPLDAELTVEVIEE